MIFQQTVEQRHARTRSSTVMDDVFPVQGLETVGHGKDRGNADAAGNEHVRGSLFVKPEQVGGAAQQQCRALGHVVMDVARSAPPPVLPQDGEIVARCIGRTAQGVFSIIAAQAEFDMGAGAPAWQGPASGVLDRQANDAFGFMAHFRYAHFAGDVAAQGGADWKMPMRLCKSPPLTFGIKFRIPFDPDMIRPPERSAGQIAEILFGQP